MNEYKLNKTRPSILRTVLANLIGTIGIGVVSYFLNSFDWRFIITWFVAWSIIDFIRFKFWKL